VSCVALACRRGLVHPWRTNQCALLGCASSVSQGLFQELKSSFTECSLVKGDQGCILCTLEQVSSPSGNVHSTIRNRCFSSRLIKWFLGAPGWIKRVLLHFDHFCRPLNNLDSKQHVQLYSAVSK
jgi:hypothetical protein